MTRFARIAHSATVAIMAVVVIAATVDGFAQSWAGLYGWAVEHGLHGWKAMSFPLLVDAFILVGELGLFALALEGHKLARRGMAWIDLALPAAAAVAGWSVSLAFNVGHVDHELSDQLTAAVAPVASMFGLLILLRTLHRLVTRASRAADTVVDDPRQTVAGPVEIQASDPAGFGQPIDQADEGSAAGGDGFDVVESAVLSARANRVPIKSIAEQLGITVYRVKKILGGSSDPDPDLISTMSISSTTTASPNGQVVH